MKTQKLCHVATEVETGVLELQAKNHQGLWVPTRCQEKARKDSTQSPDGPGPADTLMLAF